MKPAQKCHQNVLRFIRGSQVTNAWTASEPFPLSPISSHDPWKHSLHCEREESSWRTYFLSLKRPRHGLILSVLMSSCTLPSWNLPRAASHLTELIYHSTNCPVTAALPLGVSWSSPAHTHTHTHTYNSIRSTYKCHIFHTSLQLVLLVNRFIDWE